MRQFFSLVARLKGIFAERFDKSPLSDRARLRRFLRTRAAYIAQESLYGYLKTRMGTQFPQYFEDPEFSRGIRIAALKLFASCLADLTVFTVANITRDTGAEREEAAALARECYQQALQEGLADAGEGAPSAETTARFEGRIAHLNWQHASEGENAFAGSAEDIIRYAPVIDEFKQLDRAIVMNSIRFRWRDVREQFRRRVAAADILADWRGGA